MIQENRQGITQVNLNTGIVRAMHFPLAPRKEQRRIVAEIEKQFTRLEAGVAALRRVQANLKRYRAAVLKAACEGRLVPTEAELHRKLENKKFKTRNWRATPRPHPHRAPPKLAGPWQIQRTRCARDRWPTSELPEGWVWATSSNSPIGTKTLSRPGRLEARQEEHLHAERIQDLWAGNVIRATHISATNSFRASCSSNSKAAKFKPGDILISLVGTTGKF